MTSRSICQRIGFSVGTPRAQNGGREDVRNSLSSERRAIIEVNATPPRAEVPVALPAVRRLQSHARMVLPGSRYRPSFLPPNIPPQSSGEPAECVMQKNCRLAAGDSAGSFRATNRAIF